METFTTPAPHGSQMHYCGDTFLIQKKYSDFSYKIRDSGLAVNAALLDVRILDIFWKLINTLF